MIRLLLLALLALPLNSCGGGADAASAPPPGSQAFGPPWLTGQDSNGVGWVGCVDYEAPRNGDGCFIQFLSSNLAGARVSGVTLNGGLVEASPGKENGDLDIAVLSSGTTAIMAIVGGYQGSGPAVSFGPTDAWTIGVPASRARAIYLTPVACPAGVPGTPVSCVSVNGGFMPVYQ